MTSHAEAEGQQFRTPARELTATHAVPGLLGWVTTVDHKRIGIMYLLTVVFFFALGGIEALLMRIQLTVPENSFLPPDAYNQLFTLHGTTMIFFVLTPAGVGFANYIIPLMIGARDMAFPRVNALAYWLYLFSGLLLYFTLFTGTIPDGGWYGYPPLTQYQYSRTSAIDWFIISLLVSGTGTILGAINLLGTIITLRAPGMTWGRMPMFAWTMLSTAILILFAFPSLNASLVTLLFDRRLGSHFYDALQGGDPVYYQHLFWFFGHPEVYIMVLPAFGIVSEVVPVFSRKPLFGYPAVAAASLFITFYSLAVWAHHMFSVGLSLLALGFFAATSMVIAVPTGIKIFNWIATMWGGSVRFTTAMLFGIGLVGMFVVGGIGGVSLAVVPFDWQVTDSYYVVGHMHYVLFAGTAFGLLAGTYYWFPKMTGRYLSERIGKWHFWMSVVGINLTFYPMHLLGIAGMPRRIFTYPAEHGWDALNILVTIGAIITGLSVVLLLWNVWTSLRSGEPAGPDPWDGFTLEWATPSPPPPENFSGPLPPVRGRRPLWDAKYPDRADWLAEARTAGEGRR